MCATEIAALNIWQLIKELKNSPPARPDPHPSDGVAVDDPQAVLQANKAPFFFRLVRWHSGLLHLDNFLIMPQDRELDKVNAFYTIKEAEVSAHERAIQMRDNVLDRPPLLTRR